MSETIIGAVSITVLLVFSLWVVGRWLRLRLTTQSGEYSIEHTNGVEGPDPLDQLKQRHVNGELSDAEFEERLDTLLESDCRTGSANHTVAHRVERSRESE